MNTITQIIKSTYHVNGDYWTQEVLDSDVFEKANAELEALRKVADAVEHALESDAINTRYKEGQDVIEALKALK